MNDHEPDKNYNALYAAIKQQNEISESWIKQIRSEKRWKHGLALSKLVIYTAIFCTVAFVSNDELREALFNSQDEQHVAVVDVVGQIASNGPASSQWVSDGLEKAFKNKDSVAVVLNVNSPGGSPVQSELIYRQAMFLKDKYDKDLIAVIGDIGASGGYYVSTAAENIYSEQASLVGSIGVISSSFGFSEVINKLGVERRVITSGTSKSMLDPYKPLSEKDIIVMKKIMSNTHELFIQRVVESRKERISETDGAIFSGKVFDGQQALALGLIDGFKSINEIKRDYEVTKTINYSKKASALQSLGRAANVKVTSILSSIIGIDSGIQMK